ncbi:unnamed protein product, partial [Iphiclides podalirius]
MMIQADEIVEFLRYINQTAVHFLNAFFHVHRDARLLALAESDPRGPTPTEASERVPTPSLPQRQLRAGRHRRRTCPADAIAQQRGQSPRYTGEVRVCTRRRAVVVLLSRRVWCDALWAVVWHCFGGKRITDAALTLMAPSQR